MYELPDTIPDTLRRELETPLGFQGRCEPADLWPYIRAWILKEGLELHLKRRDGSSDVQTDD